MSEILKNNIKQGKRLLEDTTSYFDIKSDYIQQSEKENDGKIYMTGILSTADVPNQNRRIYPKYLLDREFNKLLPLVKDGQVVGEIDHPQDSTVSFKNASHKIVDMYWEGNNILGKIQIIRDHPAGQKILALIKEDVKIGISSRALGSTESVRLHEEYSQYGDDVEVVTDDAVFITWDLVSNPSVQGAFMIQENTMLEWNAKRNNSLPKNSNYIYSAYDKELIEFINKYKR
jgi:hypothetical protein